MPTADDLQKTIDELKSFLPSAKPAVDVVLTTKYLISPDAMYSGEYEGKHYLLINARVLDALAANNEQWLTSLDGLPVGVMGRIAGIPVREDDALIKKIMRASIGMFFEEQRKMEGTL